MTNARAEWVDYHCHLDLYPDHEALIRESDQHRIATLAVTTTPRAWSQNRKLASNSSQVRVGLGLHPQLASTHAGELSLWEELLPQARYVGEVGLDAGPRFYASLDIQKQVFERILRRCNEAGHKILTVHSVRATSMVLSMIEEHLPPARGAVVLHWFTGSVAEARRAAQMGCYFSVNSAMLESLRGGKLLATLPLTSLLTETDGPFVLRNQKPARPADVPALVARLAKARNLSPVEMSGQILANLARLEAQK